jgi:hypothetical protein
MRASSDKEEKLGRAGYAKVKAIRGNGSAAPQG